MYRQCGILRTTHFSILVTLAQLECARRIPQLGRLRQQLGSVVQIDKDDVFDSTLVEKGELM
jgi:hypothetical protein